MSDGVILRNNGDGWKVHGKVKPGIDPHAAYERLVARLNENLARYPANAAYRKLLHEVCGMNTRWQRHYVITSMPDDPDGVWSDICGDGYGKVHADIEDVVRLCGLYRLALEETTTAERG